MTDQLLLYLRDLAYEYGGELHLDASEITLCFPNSTPPKRMEDEPWPTGASASPSTTETNQYNQQTAQGRHRVLSDMDQFLKEQQLNQQIEDQQRAQQKAPKFRTGELPYRNYADGQPPRR